MIAAEEPDVAGQARRRWLRRYGLASLGAAVILVWCLIALLAPVIAPHPPAVVDVADRLKPPSDLHWLGTDVLGRDVFSRLLYGARVSIEVGVISVTGPSTET